MRSLLLQLHKEKTNLWPPHHFHDVSAPLGEQLHALQGQIKQLPVLRISLLGLLPP